MQHETTHHKTAQHGVAQRGVAQRGTVRRHAVCTIRHTVWSTAPHMMQRAMHHAVHRTYQYGVLGRILHATIGCGLLLVATACTAVTSDQGLPSGISNPAYVRTAEGAAGMAVTAKWQFQVALAEYLVKSGLLTDELRSPVRNVQLGNNNINADVAVDSRTLPYKTAAGTDKVYGYLQLARSLSNQALGALQAYDSDHSANRRGELYALQGYAVLYLADLFCSGVPLSTLDFDQDFTYKPGSDTDALYRHAVALFDTALAIVKDSAPIVNLARVGKGRALVTLGQYADAEQAVTDVPVNFVFEQRLATCTPSIGSGGVTCYVPLPGLHIVDRGTVVDREGEVGLPYFHDPRTLPQLPAVSTNINGDTVWNARKITSGGISVIRIATGLEAQLIRAEAALAANQIDRWRTILNTLRTTGTFTTAVRHNGQGDSIGVDTTYAVGAAQVPGQTTGIRPLPADSTTAATPALRRDVLFRERGFWLYLTGHRQGDLRRLMRQDGVNAYPRGSYPTTGGYGEHIDAPIPQSELLNPYFRGCLSRD